MKTTLLKWSFDQVLYTHFLYLYKFIFSGGPNAVPLLFFMLLLAFGSCSPSYYAPGPQCPPGFVRKGQSKISAAYTHSFSATGYEACFAHTPIPHLTFSANHITYSGEKNTDPNAYFVHGYLNELGVGYYTWLDPGRQFVFDLSFHYGYGNVAYRASGQQYAYQNYYVESKFRRNSLLAGLTYLSSHLEAAFSVKLSQLSYVDTRFSYFSPKDYTSPLLDAHYKYLVEPSLVVSAGPSNLKLFAGVEMAHKIHTDALRVANKRISLGLHVKF